MPAWHTNNMDDPRPGGHMGYRVEHRPPDGPSRVLAESTMLSIAQASAKTWTSRLRTAGEAGAVTIVAAATGQAVAVRPLAKGGIVVRPPARVTLPAEDPGPGRMRIDEAAELLGVSPPRVRAWIERGTLPAEKLAGPGRRRCVRRADVLALADARAGKTT